MYNLYYTYINPDLFTRTLCKLWTKINPDLSHI
jgi:hypothetical protein